MNHKQKLGYILLGAGIMAVGITIGQFITPNIEAQNNGVFDKIQCRELEVVDTAGNPAIVLTASDLGNVIWVIDVYGEPAIGLSTDEKGGSTIGVNTPDKTGVLLLAGEQGSHLLVTDSGDTAITLDSSTEGNHVTVYDRYQNPRVHLASDKNVDGVVVLDKAGNVRGSIP